MVMGGAKTNLVGRIRTVSDGGDFPYKPKVRLIYLHKNMGSHPAVLKLYESVQRK